MDQQLEHILEGIVSLARKWGGSTAALRRAAEEVTRERRHRYSWSYENGTIVVRDALGRRGYVYRRQSLKPGYPNVLETDVDKPLNSDTVGPFQSVPWEILPRGEHPFPTILAHLQLLEKRNPTIRYDPNRLEALNSLGPSSIYVGVQEFDGYFAFHFPSNTTVVLECPVVGNAIYAVPEADWESLCRLSKATLLAHSRVKRVVHGGDWLQRLKAHLNQNSSDT